MTVFEREIRRRLDELTGYLLNGAAQDFTAYRELVGKCQVLSQLLEFIAEHRAKAGTEAVDDDD